MDLTYMPGELDMKNSKKGDDTGMKRDHDSMDDFEHLDPDSPVDGHVKDKLDISKSTDAHNLLSDLIEKSHGDAYGLPSVPVFSESGKISPDSNSLLDFGVESKEIKTEVDFHSDSEGKSTLFDSGMKDDNIAPEPNKKLSSGDHSFTKSFISAEIAINSDNTGNETPVLDNKPQISAKENEDSQVASTHATDSDNDKVDSELEVNRKTKSMKEDDALPQYELKYDPGLHINEHLVGLPKPSEFIQKSQNDDDTSDHESEIDSREEVSEFVNSKDFGSPEKFKVPPVDELAKTESIAKPNPLPSKDSVKTSISDLDDIIGPEDVFKRIGLDAWFTPERLHPKVEALVYWRDPKKSGVVFGGGMVILLSLCVMSLISVIAYTSLFALMATICFRIYKNILQAVQKTSEGHPFKEFLELELSLPQDKVREVVDTAVVHINAAIAELRRLFLVEDLIDSIKFGVCLWCLTYVGAIFNGMTLVILAFVALFTVPKIYENNKASIDQYIEMGRSKVADITSKVKAAVPIGKKEPEKDKEQ